MKNWLRHTVTAERWVLILAYVIAGITIDLITAGIRSVL